MRSWSASVLISVERSHLTGIAARRVERYRPRRLSWIYGPSTTMSRFRNTVDLGTADKAQLSAPRKTFGD
jgi:hypothetical protein